METNDIYYRNFIEDISYIKEYIEDPQVSDIMVNANLDIYIKKDRRIHVGKAPNINTVVRSILSLATMNGIYVDDKYPVLETVIPGTIIRVEALLPPITTGPVLAIRKPTTKVKHVESYLKEKRMSEEQYNKIINAIEKKYNIIIAGGTGSGKTTLLNSMLFTLSIMDPECRLFVIEDTPELYIQNRDYVSTVVLPNHAVDMIRVSLRSYPDRIIFGELRHGEVAYELLKAFNTGHPGGMTTIHANVTSAKYVIERLYAMILEVTSNIKESMIEDMVQCIISIQNVPGFGPKIYEVYYTKSVKESKNENEYECK